MNKGMSEGFVRREGERRERNVNVIGFDVAAFEMFFTSFGNFYVRKKEL